MLHQELIEHFYHSFKNKNVDEMIKCYHDEIVFNDSAFGTLSANEVKSMWRMLLEKGPDVQIDYSNVAADADSGHAHWTATYVYSKKKRKVVNNVDATFEFKDGKILRHTDTFDLNIWARQALGLKSKFLIIMRVLKPVIQGKLRKRLMNYMEHNGLK